MAKDPIVQEVRSIRKEIEQQYPDAESFYEHLQHQQKRYGKRLVRPARRGRKPKAQKK